MAFSPQAFALLVIADASVAAGKSTETGYLALECVTISHPGSTSALDRDVYLVLRLNTTETPLDPERVVQRSDSAGCRTYIFRSTSTDPTELTLSFKLPIPEGSNPAYLEDLETFESIIGQYHTDLRGAARGTPVSSPTTSKSPRHDAFGGTAQNEKDLRGHLVMIDEKTGEVVGEVEDRFRIQEDPTMHTKGHENDPVIIEVAEESGAESDVHALAAFARVVPPDQQNWITNTATVVSSAISLTTNLVVTTITAASNFYINHSSPSPHHPESAAAADGSSKDASARGSAPPLPPRPRALVFPTSESTRKGLSKVHAVSGEAVKVSAKTVGFIDTLIRRAMGAKPKRDRTAFLRSEQVSPAPILPSPSTSSSGSSKSEGPAPPAYHLGTPSSARHSASPAPPPLPPRLSNKDRILISADLILSTIDRSARQLLDASTQQVGKVMQHKYGTEAAESSVLMANTARNVCLVYIDMRGIGRRALLRRAGRQYVKTQFFSNTPPPQQVPIQASLYPGPPKQ